MAAIAAMVFYFKQKITTPITTAIAIFIFPVINK
jgi:hypothetical protein